MRWELLDDVEQHDQRRGSNLGGNDDDGNGDDDDAPLYIL